MKWLFIIVIILLNSSCWSVNHKNFTLPLNTYVKSNSFKMNGYYINFDSVDNLSVLLFYNNGVVYSVKTGGVKRDKVDSFVNTYILPNKDVLSDFKNPGSFRINENKIEINLILPTHYQRHSVKELQGTLLTDTSFFIYSGYMPGGLPKQNDTIIYHFVPSTTKPDSTNWLMKRKWYRGK